MRACYTVISVLDYLTIAIANTGGDLVVQFHTLPVKHEHFYQNENMPQYYSKAGFSIQFSYRIYVSCSLIIEIMMAALTSSDC